MSVELLQVVLLVEDGVHVPVTDAGEDGRGVAVGVGGGVAAAAAGDGGRVGGVGHGEAEMRQGGWLSG